MTTSASAGPVPTSTYRVQLHAGFTFTDLAAQVPYLALLGVSHVYLSPILQAAPGSMHGYDVVDHSRLSEELGGDEGWGVLQGALREAGMSAVVDVVPNHMTLPTPARLNKQWEDVLRHGPASEFAHWFDIEWAAGQIVLPLLGSPLLECVARGEITIEGGELHYFDHVFPLAPGTEGLGLEALLDAQHYRLAFWRTGNRELDYRRFFDVTTLIGVRVEDPDVFAATHRRLLELVEAGEVTGLRIDHPDGLADPGGYLSRLAEASGGVWTVAEKILEGEEELPEQWPCAGTTGYEAMARICGLFVDPDGAGRLTSHYVELTGEPREFATVLAQSKRQAVSSLTSEVDRLLRVLVRVRTSDPTADDLPEAALREALVELLIAFGVYRAYVVPGVPVSTEAAHYFDEAADVARAGLGQDSRRALEWLREVALGAGPRTADRDEFVVRFQQTCGPAMAKGVEDTAFYRWFPLPGANEVGADPADPATSTEAFRDWASRQQRDRPSTMTSLSTHDTKRSEDVRARLAVLTGSPDRWPRLWSSWQELTGAYRPATLDLNTEYLLVQTLVGAWPIPAERLTAYLEKATREAKRHTTWTEPNAEYDAELSRFAEAVLADRRVTDLVGRFVDGIASPTRAIVLGQKLVQLLAPGVPDVYQGTELVDLSLVDPDNRRPVDFAQRRALLATLDAGTPPTTLDQEKLHLVSTVLRLRRSHPEWFTGEDATVEWVGSTTQTLAVSRSSSVIGVLTLRPAPAEAHEVRDQVVPLVGSWRDALTGRLFAGGDVDVAEILATSPVAVLVRTSSSDTEPQRGLPDRDIELS